MRKNTAFVETSLLIRADIRTVWERLVDFERYHEWNPFIVGVRRDWADPALMKFDLVWGTGGRGTSRERMVSLAAPENGRAALVYDYAAFLSACGLVKASRTQSLRAVGDHTEYHTREDFSGLLKWFIPFKAVRDGFERQARALAGAAEAASAAEAAGRQTGGNGMDQEVFEEDAVAYCGLFCGGCRVYQRTMDKAPLKDDSGNELVCHGCRNAVNTPWCRDCEIKKCCRDKQLDACIQCPDYACAKLRGFMEDPQYPYHQEVHDNMTAWSAMGTAAWIGAMKEQYRCARCGRTNDWFRDSCGNCGAGLVNGRNPGPAAGKA